MKNISLPTHIYCLRVSLDVKRHHDHGNGNSYKGKHQIGVDLLYHHGEKHGSTQAAMMLDLSH